MVEDKTPESSYTIINNRTGEVSQVDGIEERTSDRWDKVWGKQLANMLDAGGEDRARVIATLLRKKDLMNVVHLTVSEIAERSKTSTKTVTRTLKALEDKGFIIRMRQARLMITPKVICRGGRSQGMAVITLWESEQEKYDG